MKKLLASILCFSLSVTAAQVPVIAIGRADGQISGLATIDGKPHSNVAVRLRDLKTGLLLGRTAANSLGKFSFSAVSAGTFIIESVSARGTILGTSSTVTINEGSMIASDIAVRANAAAVQAAGAATGGQEQAAAAATGGSGGALSATAIALVAVGFGLGVTTGVVVAKDDASPSQ
jgi:hypothetical protein